MNNHVMTVALHGLHMCATSANANLSSPLNIANQIMLGAAPCGDSQHAIPTNIASCFSKKLAHR
jgi:hypothetical protein